MGFKITPIIVIIVIFVAICESKKRNDDDNRNKDLTTEGEKVSTDLNFRNLESGELQLLNLGTNSSESSAAKKTHRKRKNKHKHNRERSHRRGHGKNHRKNQRTRPTDILKSEDDPIMVGKENGMLLEMLNKGGSSRNGTRRGSHRSRGTRHLNIDSHGPFLRESHHGHGHHHHYQNPYHSLHHHNHHHRRQHRRLRRLHHQRKLISKKEIPIEMTTENDKRYQ